MSVCAVMAVRDEADIVAVTINHLLHHVDEVDVVVFPSSDETSEIVEALPVRRRFEPHVHHSQPVLMTRMALEALERGHEWVLPVDADEIWHCRYSDERIKDYLEGVEEFFGNEVMAVRARMIIHIPTAEDPEDENPARRIRWHRGPKKAKRACRLRKDLRIGLGMVGAHRIEYTGTPAKPCEIKGLDLRHFPWRSEEQTMRKYRNQNEAWGRRTSGKVGVFSEHPLEDGLVYDPAPLRD